MDPSFLFFLCLIVLVVLATTNDILFWSDAESILRKRKIRRMKQLKPVAAPVIREADLLGTAGRRTDGGRINEALAQPLQDE